MLFGVLKSELAPFEDQGTVAVLGTAPEGATLEYTDKYALQIEEILAAVPELQGYLVISGSPTVQNLIIFSRLIAWGAPEHSHPKRVAGTTPDLTPVAGLPH